MQDSRHILDVKKKQIESNLENLFQQVLASIGEAMHCLNERDTRVCERLIRQDVAINEQRRLIEQDCLVAIASQQPVAHDLRDIVADMRMATELERMGDYARDIAITIQRMDDASLEGLGREAVLEMSRLCQTMLADVMRAHQTADARLARRVAALDDELDRQLHMLVSPVMEAMRADPALVNNGLRMFWIAHILERCGDRCTNIAEQVVFRVEGEVEELG